MAGVEEILEGLKSEHSSMEMLPEFRGETSCEVSPDGLLPLMQALRSAGFDFLVDISSVDNFGEDPRFVMVYELMHMEKKLHLRVKVTLGEDDPEVPTVSGIWKTANWHEREVYDMMGITFKDHPDMTRILMWDGYPYFPLRKEFPLEGKPSDMPDIAFTRPAPLEGGPFVTSTTSASKDREPRSRAPEPS